MDKVMAIGFLFLFCVVFLMIEGSSGLAINCPGPMPVSAVIILELDLVLQNHLCA